MNTSEWISPKVDQARIIRLKRPLASACIQAFRRVIYGYYEAYGRSFPWRDTSNPYHIIASEVMLQQPQTDRVVQKYKEFIERLTLPHNLCKPACRTQYVVAGISCVSA